MGRMTWPATSSRPCLPRRQVRGAALAHGGQQRPPDHHVHQVDAHGMHPAAAAFSRAPLLHVHADTSDRPLLRASH